MILLRTCGLPRMFTGESDQETGKFFIAFRPDRDAVQLYNFLCDSEPQAGTAVKRRTGAV